MVFLLERRSSVVQDRHRRMLSREPFRRMISAVVALAAVAERDAEDGGELVGMLRERRGRALSARAARWRPGSRDTRVRDLDHG
jgi:hypothetical protein